MKSAVLHPAIILLLLVFVILPAAGADNTTLQPVTSAESPVTTAPDITAGPGNPENPAAPPGTESTDTTAEPQLTKEEAIFWATLGIFVSFIIPVLKKYSVQVATLLRKEPDAEVDQAKEIWKAISPYVATTLLSLFVAVVIVASLYSAKTPMPGWYVPFLAGYAWDSTIQKIKPGKDDPE